MASYPRREDLDSLPRSEVLKASPRMFESLLLDRLSRVHWSVPAILFTPAIALVFAHALALTTAWTAMLWALGGYLFWTLTEYWLHRLVFHFEPDSGVGARLHWVIHGVHHDHPNDPLRLVMPPSVSVPLSGAFYGLFVFALGSPTCFAFSAGFWAGYLAYDMLHYYVHHLPGGRKPRAWLPRKLHELHMRHHFQDHDSGYGVSAPFWDHVFGTTPHRQEPQRRRSPA